MFSLVVKNHPVIVRPVAPRDRSRFVEGLAVSMVVSHRRPEFITGYPVFSVSVSHSRVDIESDRLFNQCRF